MKRGRKGGNDVLFKGVVICVGVVLMIYGFSFGSPSSNDASLLVEGKCRDVNYGTVRFYGSERSATRDAERERAKSARRTMTSSVFELAFNFILNGGKLTPIGGSRANSEDMTPWREVHASVRFTALRSRTTTRITDTRELRVRLSWWISMRWLLISWEEIEAFGRADLDEQEEAYKESKTRVVENGGGRCFHFPEHAQWYGSASEAQADARSSTYMLVKACAIAAVGLAVVWFGINIDKF